MEVGGESIKSSILTASELTDRAFSTLEEASQIMKKDGGLDQKCSKIILDQIFLEQYNLSDRTLLYK